MRSEKTTAMVEHWRSEGFGVTDYGWGLQVHTEDGLFNPVRVQTLYTREKPWHRVVAEMAAAGHTVMEIVQATGRARRSVQMVLGQPFAQQRIARKAAMNASEEIKAILEKIAPESVKRIETLATCAESEQVRLAADREILDRFLGKPNQPITKTDSVPVTKLTDEELESRIQQHLQAPDEPSRNGNGGVESSEEYT